MKINSLGHVVIRVTDLERSEAFYNGVLGLPICAYFDQDGMQMTSFTLGNHHDFAISKVKGDELSNQAPGLDHVAFCIRTEFDDLKEAKQLIDETGIACMPIDHEVTKSLYIADPDGNGVELYIDASDAWRQEPQRVAQAVPLEL